MKREIKFRAWDTISEKMCWVNDINFGACVAWLDNIRTSHMKFLELMQFTGIVDKNGKDIYEGDIVKTADDGDCVVEFRFGSFGVEVERACGIGEYPDEVYSHFVPLDSDEDNCLFFVVKDEPITEDAPSGIKQEWCCEVIGNIYENPELWEEK